MTNREKFAEQILDIACNGYCIAVNSDTGGVMKCISKYCNICAFKKQSSCTEKLIEWANSEYVEKPKISESDRRFLDYLPDEYKWMAKDKDESFYIYYFKPFKEENYWNAETVKNISEYKISFPMVKWEDKEPWLIEDLKNLEVVDEYGKDDN